MNLRVEIVTPTSVAYQREAVEVRAPGYLGEFGVLPDHSPLLSVITPGRVTVMTADGEQESFIVGRGFIEAGPSRLVVLTETCEPVAEVDRAAAQRLLEESERALAVADPDSGEYVHANYGAQMGRARLKA